MLDLTRMEITRLFKQKSTYTILLSLLAIFAFSVLMIHLVLVDIHELTPSTETKGDEELNVSVKIEKNTDFPFKDSKERGENFVVEHYSNSAMAFFLPIFGAIFFTQAYQNGFIKNFIGSYKNRSSYIIAQYFAGLIFLLLAFILSAAILLIGAPMIYKGFFKYQDLAGILKLLGLQFYLHAGFLALMLFISSLTKKSSTSLAIGIAYNFVLHRFITSSLTQIIKKIFNITGYFDLMDYTIMGNIHSLQWGVDSQTITRALIVCTVIGILSLLGASLSLQKSDI